MAMQFHSQLAAAARVAYTTLDNTERKSAEEFIQKIKDMCRDQLVELGFSYVSNNETVLQHFGYHLLEECIDKWWNQYSNQSISDWKNKLLNLGREMGNGRLPTSSVIIQKLANVTALVAIRLWPSQWADLIPNLTTLWKIGGEIPSEIALRSLVSLFTESNIRSYEQHAPFQKVAAAPSNRWDVAPIEATRKAELLKALQSNCPAIISTVNTFVNQVIDQHLRTGCQFAKKELQLCVELYNETCCKVPLEALIASNTTATWGKLLSSSATCTEMAQVIRNVVESAESVNASSLHFLENLLSYIASLITNHAKTGHTERDLIVFSSSYSFMLKLTDITVTIVRNEELIQKLLQNPSLSKGVKDVLVSMLIHPSGVIHLNALVVLKRLLLNKSMADVVFRWGDSEFLMPALQAISGAHLVKGYLSNITSSRMYSEEDFASDDEVNIHHTFLMSTHKELCAMIAAGRPQVVGRFISALLSELLWEHPQPTLADPRTGLGNVQTSSATYFYWARAETSLHHLTEGNLPLNDQTKVELVNIANHFMTLSVTDAILLSKYVGVLQHIVQLLCRQMAHRDIFDRAIQTLIKYMSFPMSADSVSSRRKVQTVLIHLSDNLKSEMVPYLNQLLEAWVKYQQSNTLTDQETSLLTETICNTVNLLPELQRKTMVTTLLQPISEPWSSLCSDLFDDVSKFKGFIEGLVLTDQSTQSQGNMKATKTKLRKCISILQGVFKRIVPGPDINPTNLNILDPLLQLISCLHQVWTPSQLSPAAAAILTPPNEEKEQCVGGSTGTANITNPIFHARQYVGQCRASCYCLLGGLGHFYRNDYVAFHRKVVSKIFTPSLQNLELLQLKYFWNEFCIPFFLQTPVECGMVLRESLPQLISFLYVRLNDSWLQWSNSSALSQSITTPGNTSSNKITTNDGWELKILTDFTQEIAGAFFHIANIALGSEAVNTKLKKCMRSPDDGAILKVSCSTICSDTELLAPVISILSATMCWPAASASVQAVEALNKIIPAIPAVNRSALEGTYLKLLGASLHRVAELQTPDKLKANRESQLLTYSINLITEVYSSLLPRKEPGQMLLQMGIPPATVCELESTLTPCSGAGGNARKFRAKFKALLNPPKGSQRVIKGLPQFSPITRNKGNANSAEDEYQCTLAMGNILS